MQRIDDERITSLMGAIYRKYVGDAIVIKQAAMEVMCEVRREYFC